METLDANAQQRRETFALFGLAMYHAQCVEKSLAILVSSVFNKEFHKSDVDRRDEIQDEAFAKTTGKLIARLRKQIAVPADLDKLLAQAHKKRNWLAHDYFWDRAVAIMKPSGREKMIAELRALADFFSDLDLRLTGVCDRYLKKIGVTQEFLDKEMAKIHETDK